MSPSPLTQRLERLILAGSALPGDSPLPAVLQWVADTARDVLEARYAAIGLLAPDNRAVETFITSGVSDQDRRRIGHPPVGRGVLGAVIQTGQPIRIPEVSADPRAVGFPPHHPAMHAFLGVPVVGRLGVLGNLYFADKRTGEAFTAEDEHLATLLATRAASAVEDARSYAESARLVGEVQSLLRSRERFFAMVNHELRNSIAAVYGWAEMLVRKKNPGEVPRAAFEVVEAAQSAVSLINDLLDLSRLDEDRLKPEIRPVDCGAVIRRAVAKVTPAAKAKAVTLHPSFPASAMACETDANRVEQILVNLLANAIRHCPEGGAVGLRTEHDAAEVRVLVQDQGPGIPEENLERIFDVYYTKPGEEGQGVGLGLPLSRRLARLLGGDLMAANGSAGGATFTLRIPLRHASSA